MNERTPSGLWFLPIYLVLMVPLAFVAALVLYGCSLVIGLFLLARWSVRRLFGKRAPKHTWQPQPHLLQTRIRK